MYVTTALVLTTALLAVEPAKEQATQQPPFFITPAEAREVETKNALPISKFYDTPERLEGEPGKLLRSEEFSEYTFPFPGGLKAEEMGVKTVRFLYLSQSASGKLVPASGVVVIPYGKPPAGGWPVVVWAHGTCGVARPFAPSLMKDLYYSWEGLLQWPMLGYAVVAPDYAGLGTKVKHEYLMAPAQGQDVIYSVPAARKAVPQLGPRWVAIGHSQGGTAVLFAAELQSKVKDPNYLGAIAIAPGGDLESVTENISKSTNHGYCAFLAYGIKSVYPEFKHADFLSPEAVKLMGVVENGGWYVTLSTYAYQVQVGKMLQADWKRNEQFKRFCRQSRLGQKPPYGPVLLLQGEADKVITTKVTDALYQRMQRHGASVQYKKYPGLDHDPLMFGSFRDQLRWAQDRFNGKPLGDRKGRR